MTTALGQWANKLKVLGNYHHAESEKYAEKAMRGEKSSSGTDYVDKSYKHGQYANDVSHEQERMRDSAYAQRREAEYAGHGDETRMSWKNKAPSHPGYGKYGKKVKEHWQK